MTEVDQAWSRSFAMQALSDLDARDVLATATVANCHRLHYLQMAAEKLCKAYLVLGRGYDQVKKSHAYTERHLPLILRNEFISLSGPAQEAKGKRVRQLAREIELLAPALTDSSSREDNCEYPWRDSVKGIQTPCLYHFPNLDDTRPELAAIIKMMRQAAERLVA